ncbi:hypothetical protein [Pseudomonas sp. LS-2]|uniref:hypothetical protein n=1 Tax=Pseudomonas sp. LS-2 TaxID=2315859 RepID=UPI000E76CEE4|nr:hypothetical protein [Pseudomonas sp. LS-2]RJX78998.1 hypothetical protein D3M70_16480 [Pseudomonas sp. LS-2]
MTKASERHIIALAAMLHSLRKAVDKLESIELAQVQHLQGEQTVDHQQSLSQCFTNLQRSISDMENTLVTLAEATGEISKL